MRTRTGCGVLSKRPGPPREPGLISSGPSQFQFGAIEIARAQSAKSLELRATISLCRLKWRQGNGAEAGKQLILPI